MIKIGTIELSDPAAFDLTVTHSPIQSKSILRTKNGTGIIASHWKKRGISITGSGWIPEGLADIDEDAVVDIHTIDWQSIADTSPIITLPGVFRLDDFAPQGIAIVNGEAVNTAVSLAGAVATLTSVSGATQYHVNYCPIITSLIASIDRSFNAETNTWTWTLEAEQQ